MLKLVTPKRDVYARLRLLRLARLFETPAQKCIREGLEILRSQDWRSVPSWIRRQRV